MAFKLLIKPIVFADAEEAIAYYEKKSKGLGKRFYNNFLIALDHIETKPFAFSYIKNPVRRHLIEKFPYKVYYFVSERQFSLLALLTLKEVMHL